VGPAVGRPGAHPDHVRRGGLERALLPAARVPAAGRRRAGARDAAGPGRRGRARTGTLAAGVDAQGVTGDTGQSLMTRALCVPRACAQVLRVAARTEPSCINRGFVQRHRQVA
jgi:hypothetical protein